MFKLQKGYDEYVTKTFRLPKEFVDEFERIAYKKASLSGGLYFCEDYLASLASRASSCASRAAGILAPLSESSL